MGGATTAGQSNPRSGMISSNALIKSHQHIGGIGANNNIYNNMNN